MKKYLFGLIAVVFALGFSAFKTRTANTVIYVYDAPGGSYSVANIETEANWKLQTEEECPSDLNERACTIVVDPFYLTTPGAADLDLADNGVFVEAHSTQPKVAFVKESGSSIGADIQNDQIPE